MKSLPYIFIAAILALTACNASKTLNIFGGKTAHAKYENIVEETSEGREWKAIAERSLAHPQDISLPYKIQGFFPGDRSRALSFSFPVKKGERISILLTRELNTDLKLYSDLFIKDGDENDHVISGDKENNAIEYDADENGKFILRIQPEIMNTGAYTLTITTGPSLGFPVKGTARTGSFWGDSRDGGKRSHEGIDIFAKKGTPVVAAADGYVTSVKNGGLGGKTVSMRPTGRNLSLYYAHLDKQSVQEGDHVKKGDVLGTVGNTGNAKHTPAHLHFGIYTYGGAVDPYPFVQNTIKKIPVVPDKELNGSLKLLKSQTISGALITANTILTPLAVNAAGYIAELPEGNIVQMPFTSVKWVKQPDIKTAIAAPLKSNKKS